MAIRAWAAGRAVNIAGSYASTHQLDNTGMVVLEADSLGGWRLLDWVESPLGGTQLADARAIDPTGQTLLRALQKLD
jgi:probable phosphoglycerate mutase